MTEKQDNKNWFSRMVTDHMDALYGVALRLTGSGTDAEDLVAETVIKAWSRIDTLEDQGRWRPWVFRILHNEFVSNYRKASVRPAEVSFEGQETDTTENIVSMLMDQPDEFLNWWANPEQEYVNALLGEQIHEAINRLPEAFRITILLVNVEELSYDEAAVVLGIPRGTVRSRMKRGRMMLQKVLWVQAQEAGLNNTGARHE